MTDYDCILQVLLSNLIVLDCPEHTNTEFSKQCPRKTTAWRNILKWLNQCMCNSLRYPTWLLSWTSGGLWTRSQRAATWRLAGTAPLPWDPWAGAHLNSHSVCLSLNCPLIITYDVNYSLCFNALFCLDGSWDARSRTKETTVAVTTSDVIYVCELNFRIEVGVVSGQFDRFWRARVYLLAGVCGRSQVFDLQVNAAIRIAVNEGSCRQKENKVSCDGDTKLSRLKPASFSKTRGSIFTSVIWVDKHWSYIQTANPVSCFSFSEITFKYSRWESIYK